MKEKLQQLMKSEGLTSSRDPRNPAFGNLPHSRRTEQTGIRFAAEDSPEVSARQSGLVAARLRTDVSNRQSEKFLFNERNRRWKWSDWHRTVRDGTGTEIEHRRFGRSIDTNGRERQRAVEANRYGSSNPRRQWPESRRARYSGLCRSLIWGPDTT